MNTHESYVSIETAKLLKEAGFDWGTFSHWTESDINNPDFKFSGLSDKPILYDGHTPIEEDIYAGRKKDWNNYNNECPLIYNYSAPTLDVAQRWLREVKLFDVYIMPSSGLYFFTLRKYENTTLLDFLEFPNYEPYKTYEQALEAGIKKALELILEKEE